jgi:hypothetical protein
MQLEFDEWWKDFESKHKNDKDGGLEELKDLKRTLGTFPANKRIQFIDELISRNMTIIAAELIESYGNNDQKRFIRDKLREWINSKSERYVGEKYVLTVLRTFEVSDLDLLRAYFNEYSGLMIPFELYNIDKSLFLESFEKILKEVDDERIYKYDGLLYLTSHLDILEFLIDNLSSIQSKRIQEFCKIKSNHSYINNENWKNELLALANKKL